MTEEQRTQASKLENILDELRKVADLFNKAGYNASPYEWQLLQWIKEKVAICEELASK